MIWGYPYFRKHPYTSSDSTSVSKNRIKESWLTVKFLVEICAKQNSNDRVHAVCLGQNEICITGRVLVILNLLQATGSSNKCWQTKPCNWLHQAKSARAARALNWYRSRKDKCSIEGWYSGLFFLLNVLAIIHEAFWWQWLSEASALFHKPYCLVSPLQVSLQPHKHRLTSPLHTWSWQRNVDQLLHIKRGNRATLQYMQLLLAQGQV